MRRFDLVSTIDVSTKRLKEDRKSKACEKGLQCRFYSPAWGLHFHLFDIMARIRIGS